MSSVFQSLGLLDRANPPTYPEGPRLVVTTAPTVELHVVTDDLVQQMLRLDSDADATYVTLLLAAARKYFERTTGLALINRTLRADFDRVPYGDELVLPVAPLSSITSISYKPTGYTSGALTAFAASSYAAGTTGNATANARVVLAEGAGWPTCALLPAALQVTFVAGYGAAATDVPEDIRLAVLMLAAWWYENRLPINVGNIVAELPLHLNAIIESHRVSSIA